MKVHHHLDGHLCISASLTQTKALRRKNPPVWENSALILCRGKSSMSSFALQASGWNLSRVKKLRIYSHIIAFSSPGNCGGGQPQVTGQGSRYSENHMDQETNSLWPYTGPVPWSWPRSEAVLYRSTNYKGQSGLLLLPLCLQGLQECSNPESNSPGEVKEKGWRATLQNQFGLESYPWNHFTSAHGTPGQCNRYQGHEVQQLCQRENYKPGKRGLPRTHNRRKDDSTGELNSLSNLSSEYRQPQSSTLQREPRTGSFDFETFWQRLDEFFSLGAHYKNFQNPFTT